MTEFQVLKQDSETNARTGILTRTARHDLPQVSCKTPTCIVSTCRGSIPHVTNDLLSSINNQLIVALESTDFLLFNSNLRIKGAEIVANAGSSIHQYCNLQQFPVYLSFVSQQVEKINYSEKSQQFKVYQRGSSVSFSEQDYLEWILHAKCDMIECPSVVNEYRQGLGRAANSRESRESLRLQSHFMHCWSVPNNETTAIGIVQGGTEWEERKIHAQTISQITGLGGFYVDAFDQKMSLAEQKKLTNISLQYLPSHLPRFMKCSSSLEQVLNMVTSGVDLFISCYPYTLSLNGYALDLPIKRNLWDIIYQRDASPISLQCDCFVCHQYSRAYINHLLNVHEMLAMTLLMIHNMQQYTEFFRQVQQAIETNSFSSFQQKFLASRRNNSA
eukprot:jgi/Galph1/6099/GphlegSOOS_G4757.1